MSYNYPSQPPSSSSVVFFKNENNGGTNTNTNANANNNTNANNNMMANNNNNYAAAQQGFNNRQQSSNMNMNMNMNANMNANMNSNRNIMYNNNNNSSMHINVNTNANANANANANVNQYGNTQYNNTNNPNNQYTSQTPQPRRQQQQPPQTQRYASQNNTPTATSNFSNANANANPILNTNMNMNMNMNMGNNHINNLNDNNNNAGAGAGAGGIHKRDKTKVYGVSSGVPAPPTHSVEDEANIVMAPSSPRRPHNANNAGNNARNVAYSNATAVSDVFGYSQQSQSQMNAHAGSSDNYQQTQNNAAAQGYQAQPQPQQQQYQQQQQQQQQYTNNMNASSKFSLNSSNSNLNANANPNPNTNTNSHSSNSNRNLGIDNNSRNSTPNPQHTMLASNIDHDSKPRASAGASTMSSSSYRSRNKFVDDANEPTNSTYAQHLQNQQQNQQQQQNPSSDGRAAAGVSFGAGNTGNTLTLNLANPGNNTKKKKAKVHKRDKTKIYGEDQAVPAPPTHSVELEEKIERQNAASSKWWGQTPAQRRANQQQSGHNTGGYNSSGGGYAGGYNSGGASGYGYGGGSGSGYGAGLGGGGGGAGAGSYNNYSTVNIGGYGYGYNSGGGGGGGYGGYGNSSGSGGGYGYSSGGGNSGGNEAYWKYWASYYHQQLQTAQAQAGSSMNLLLQKNQMDAHTPEMTKLMDTQKETIESLQKQLRQRDVHYKKTMRDTLANKDLEISELTKENFELQNDNRVIGALQMKVIELKQTLMKLEDGSDSSLEDADENGSKKSAFPGAGLIKKLISKTSNDGKPAPATANSSGPNPKLKKYNKMKKIGMPMVSIINKMRMDQCSPELIAEFKGEKPATADADEGPTIDLSDPKFKKYQTMKKIGMPMASIVNKMRMDGCSKEERDAMQGKKSKKSGQTAKEDKMTAMRELAINLGLTPKTNRVPTKVERLKRFHWVIIPLKDIKQTFWERINLKGPPFVDLGPKFELDFQIRSTKPKVTKNPRSPKSGPTNLAEAIGGGKRRVTKDNRITWLSAKRDQNIQIALRKIGLPNEALYDGIVYMNEQIINIDILATIYDLVPNVDEQAKCEQKINELAEDVELCGFSEMFHIELSTIPEVKQQLTKWFFAKTFREQYMDRLAAVNLVIQAAKAIKESAALHRFLQVLLSMGNLMNHGTPKCMVYGFKLDSLRMIDNIKDYGGRKNLAMWLYQFCYNHFPETREIFAELAIVRKAVRVEIGLLETSIKKMADEFLTIDLFCRRLQDDFHPEDTKAFREYMQQFADQETMDMMNLKVKVQNAETLVRTAAVSYVYELSDDKPESLFKIIQEFLDILEKGKRQLLKLEKERAKLQLQRQRAKDKLERQKNRRLKNEQQQNGNNNNNGGGGGGGGGGENVADNQLSVYDRINRKKTAEIDEEEKGNLLFYDLKNAANDFAERQATMQEKLNNTFQEKKALSQGMMTQSMQDNPIKRRLSAQVSGMSSGDGGGGGIDMNEIERLRRLHGGGPGQGPGQPPGQQQRPAQGPTLTVPQSFDL